MKGSKLDIALGLCACAVLTIFAAILVGKAVDGKPLYDIARDFQGIGAASIALAGAILAYRAQIRKITADMEQHDRMGLNVAEAVMVEIESAAQDFLPMVVSARRVRAGENDDRTMRMWRETIVPGFSSPCRRAVSVADRLWPMLERTHTSRHRDIAGNLSRLDQLRRWAEMSLDEDVADDLEWVDQTLLQMRRLILAIDPSSIDRLPEAVHAT